MYYGRVPKRGGAGKREKSGKEDWRERRESLGAHGQRRKRENGGP